MNEGEAAPTSVAVQNSRNLLARVAAAVVLAPLAIAIAYAGGWLWTALVTLAAIGLYLEWLTIVGVAGETRAVAAGVLALVAAGLFLAAARIEAAFIVLSIGLVAVAAISQQRRGWITGGFLYSAAAQAASVLTRLDSTSGFAALVFILLIVWVTDIGGYFAGRGIGGPKLWPRVSPKKTWAGATGGFVASIFVAAGFVALHFGTAGALLTLGAILSIVSQLGDLFESAVKRRFGVKDSSHIIPGHGGLLDRLDGFVAAIVLAAILGVVRGGMDGVGRGLMIW
ncbi:MAG: phosphatidate cytidylyltransferase [Bradyrhizobium sp.]